MFPFYSLIYYCKTWHHIEVVFNLEVSLLPFFFLFWANYGLYYRLIWAISFHSPCFPWTHSSCFRLLSVEITETWNHILLDFTFFKDLIFFLSVCVCVYVHEMVHESAVPSEARRFQILWNWYKQLSCLIWVLRIKLCKSSPLLCF